MNSREAALRFLIEIGAASSAHSQDVLLLHLLGTEAILQTWGGSPALCHAGLFHAIYGTHSFRRPPLMPTDQNRDKVRRYIGEDSESIVFAYSNVTLKDLRNNNSLTHVPNLSFESTDTRPSSIEVMSSLLNLIVANEVEQLARASFPLSESLLNLDEEMMIRLLPDARSYLNGLKANVYGI